VQCDNWYLHGFGTKNIFADFKDDQHHKKSDWLFTTRIQHGAVINNYRISERNTKINNHKIIIYVATYLSILF